VIHAVVDWVSPVGFERFIESVAIREIYFGCANTRNPVRSQKCKWIKSDRNSR
jgi:hypothetical protein